MSWNDDLPDTSHWQPQSKKQDTLSNALMLTCQIAQRRIVASHLTLKLRSFSIGSVVTLSRSIVEECGRAI